MNKKINFHTNATIDQPHYPIAYYPIDNDDNSSVSFYEKNGYTVKVISFNENSQCFAFIPVETQEQAKRINQEFDRFRLLEHNDLQFRMNNEIPFDEINNAEYDSVADHNDPAIILENLDIKKALFQELNRLTDEDYHICQMIGSNMSESEMAAELNIPYLTLHKRKINLLRRLRHQLKEYR